MKSRQIWIVAGTAVVSFALGAAFTSSLRKPEAAPAAAIRQTRSNGRSSPATESGDAEELSGRTRTGTRDEKKKPGEPRISIPLATVAKVISAQQFNSSFSRLDYEMLKALPLLGTTEQETNDIKALLKQAESQIYTAEKKHLKVIQADETQIRLDNSSMEAPAKAIVQQTQDGIRSVLPADLAEVLISSINWNEFYPTDEKFYPVLGITRSTSGKLTAWTKESSGGTGYPVDPKFADDGTPIPADQVFDDRWSSFIKGRTLLPQNEK